MHTVEHRGIECVELSNGHLRLLVTKSVGPRILSLQIEGSENIFAELGDSTLDCPGTGDFTFYGGHRLWCAPEDPAITYLPDDGPVEVTLSGHELEVIQPIEPKTGIQKQLRILLEEGAAVVRVDHILRNRSQKCLHLAPWAITQLKPGGTAVMPQFGGHLEDNPTLPNRSVVLWPYTDPGSEHIIWGKEFIAIRADMREGDLKLGFPNRAGWLAYWREDVLFIKRAAYHESDGYLDFGSSSECYCNPKFLELETLGPMTTLDPGSSVCHLETWEVYPGVDWKGDVGELVSIISDRAED